MRQPDDPGVPYGIFDECERHHEEDKKIILKAVFWIALVAATLIGASALWLNTADAQEPPKFLPVGTVTGGVTILCYTEEQLASILDANRDNGFHAGVAIFRSLAATRNEKGESLCAIGEYKLVLVETMAMYRNLDMRLVSSLISPHVYITRVMGFRSGNEYFVTTTMRVVTAEEYELLQKKPRQESSAI